MGLVEFSPSISEKPSGVFRSPKTPASLARLIFAATMKDFMRGSSAEEQGFHTPQVESSTLSRAPRQKLDTYRVRAGFVFLHPRTGERICAGADFRASRSDVQNQEEKLIRFPFTNRMIDAEFQKEL